MGSIRAGFVSSAAQKVKRFDGTNKSSRAWDGLRKDEDLWVEDGDCFIHLYAPGCSQRGPSLKIPIALLAKIDNTYLLSQCVQKHGVAGATASSGTETRSDCGSNDPETYPFCDLFIAAPTELARAEAFLYHVCTRNYFAYLSSRPIVGETLGQALADLAHRIEAWHPESVGTTAFLDYCQEQGYLDFANRPDYALAGMRLAELARIRHVWIDAFAHCVGMRDQLDNSPEASRLSKTSKALISRASLEMELHTARVIKAVGTFLEEELGPECHGLSRPMRDHLDRFRSTLHCFYVNTMGYFPPDSGSPVNKQLWQSMHDDFRCLYDYLADTHSTIDLTSSRGLSGGICTIQNTTVFNQRHGYVPLPHPVPLLPRDGTRQATKPPQKGLRSFMLGRSGTAPQPRLRSHVKQALATASNADNSDVISNRLVQEYIRFEGVRLEEKVTLSESRKVRWLLIYGVLQMLISMTRAPSEVQDSKSPLYSMCILTSGCPPWEQPATTLEGIEQPAKQLTADTAAVREALEEDRISIHPDCEAESAEDYFALTSLNRSDSDRSLTQLPQSSSPQLSRTASIRSSVNTLHRSVVGSLQSRRNSVNSDGILRSRRNSVRRDSFLYAPKKMASFCEILVEGYGNGADESKSAATSFQGCVELAELEAPVPEVNTMVPILEMHQLGVYDDAGPSPASSTHSGVYSQFSDLSGSTTHLRECDSPATELSSPATDKFDFGSDTNLFKFEFDFHQKGKDAESKLGVVPQPSATLPPLTYRAKRPIESEHAGRFSVTAGCYTPTGTAAPSVDTTVKLRNMSSESLQSLSSSASSEYPEDSRQAAEIEEQEVRGRPRVRIRAFGIVDGRISLPQSPFGEAR
ncbi:hypothetical protein DOTSEDRAFT_56706 [Dothistroma septosporum NZE10]|uniref:DUF8004 domain-containing protein n=1 Tax=Dothistroma septosporum (strain NZE10 / CBS 128990) TaxID=675120 RepID=M2YJZ0_DOTSN|nr:hypothetical protein DOTSEDRAFT_56706 [Dothistroma septosporum NZE10]